MKHHQMIIPFATMKPSSTATPITMKLQILTFVLVSWSLLLFCRFFPGFITKTPTTITKHLVSDRTHHHHCHRQQNPPKNKKKPQSSNSCSPNSLVYIYNLPPKFTDCHKTNTCPSISHRGLGPPLPVTTTWFKTDQFTTELIFHARLVNHPCRTHNPRLARLFYVPFYTSSRTSLIIDLSRHLLHSRWWKRLHGSDHFMALGLTMQDPFGRVIRNMSFLSVEIHPWKGKGANQFAIPYPSYFHPYTKDQLTEWQRHVLTIERPHLFSFVGSMRKSDTALAGHEIVRQCQMSSNCTVLDCGVKGEGKRSICYDPVRVVGVMTRSKFCLHPPGGSFTRRSIFDSFLAGCVPVFFTKDTAYDQYRWYLPGNGSLYSVLIGSRKKIEEVLGGISEKVVDEMRKRVVALLPDVTYMHPNGSPWGVRDAVDVALEAFSKQVASKKSLPFN